MLKVALIIVVVGSVIGALMPSNPMAAARPARPVMVELAPPPTRAAPDDGSGTIRLARQDDGHFYVDTLVNGMPVRFLVDTGASMVALTVKDAQYAAVPINPAQFQTIARGASGAVRGQMVQLDQLSIVGRAATNVDAIVIEGGEQSLLGQSFLSRFDTVEIHGDEMVLY